ncbi:hypothetical protein LUX05_04860 [Streptomyces somaliensis]|uniref:hypothetical protein n=1 Tax=Streptomyces somaliensis TaxID=78355 RepID=UPI0034E96E6B|nr:hypothetical protein [Streptomyces somaliensis]MCP9973664.1 hypothetical protein [Streptomyces somaliensis]
MDRPARTPTVRGADVTGTRGARRDARDAFALVLLPVSLLAAVPAGVLASAGAFAGGGAGGGARRWFGGGRAEDRRADAQAAKDEAVAAFYELDTAQRGLRISVETIAALDGSPAADRAVEEFAALGRRVDEASGVYIEAVDGYDLDRADLDAATAARARTDLARARDGLLRVRGELERFEERIAPLLAAAETRLARLAPAVERARAALLAASGALDAVRGSGLRADEQAARLAALAPELTRLNEGAGRHGVAGTLQRADRVLREAEAVRAEAERLPERAAETDRRLVSLRTRAQALANRAASVEPVLSELRRRFSAACWQDLQPVPARAAESVRRAEERLTEAGRARDEQRWADATALLGTVRALLNTADEAVSAAGERLRRLDAVSGDPRREIERTRFAIRDAQRLAMEGRHTPDPRHAGPLDEAVARLDRAIGGLEGRHPDYWRFLTETEAVRAAVARVVELIREERGGGPPGRSG